MGYGAMEERLKRAYEYMNPGEYREGRENKMESEPAKKTKWKRQT